eukprot:m.391910 g.391910  ORF g.391910 m.391910 type:complete len:121 (+) comp16762_c0_seq12:5248-5610(+)
MQQEDPRVCCVSGGCGQPLVVLTSRLCGPFSPNQTPEGAGYGHTGDSTRPNGFCPFTEDGRLLPLWSGITDGVSDNELDIMIEQLQDKKIPEKAWPAILRKRITAQRTRQSRDKKREKPQ